MMYCIHYNTLQWVPLYQGMEWAFTNSHNSHKVVRQKKESFLSCQFVYLPDICWVDWVNLLLIFNEDIFSLMCIFVYNIASKPHFLTTLQNYLYNSHGTRVATYQGSRIFIYFILYFILFFDFEYVKNM